MVENVERYLVFGKKEEGNKKGGGGKRICLKQRFERSREGYGQNSCLLTSRYGDQRFCGVMWWFVWMGNGSFGAWQRGVI